MPSDIEQRLIYSLLTAPKQLQDEFYIKQVPLGVFKIRPQEMIWIYRFRTKYGAYPSLKAYEIKFDEVTRKHRDSLPACLEPVLDMAMYEQLKDINTKTKEILDQDDVLGAMAYMKQQSLKLTSFSAEYSDVNFATSRGALNRFKELVRVKNNIEHRLIDTPWPSLNRLIHFYRPGNTIVLASRTNIGKTWIVSYWAHYLAKKGVRTLFVSKEMPTDEIEDRFECIQFGLPFDQLVSGEMHGRSLRSWRELRKLKLPETLFITGDETIEGTGFSHIVSKVQQYLPQIVFIDGAYLLQPEGLGKHASYNDRLRFISNRSKALAKYLKVVMVLVLQTNRSAEEKDGNTSGGLNTIYGSDTFAQDTDSLMLLKGKRGASTRIIDLAKGRNSAIGELTTNFQITPFPNFEEVRSLHLKQNRSGKVEFKGIKVK